MDYQWRDIGYASKSHFVDIDAVDFSPAICGRLFIAKDIYPGEVNNPRCKQCEKHAGDRQ